MLLRRGSLSLRHHAHGRGYACVRVAVCGCVCGCVHVCVPVSLAALEAALKKVVEHATACNTRRMAVGSEEVALAAALKELGGSDALDGQQDAASMVVSFATVHAKVRLRGAVLRLWVLPPPNFRASHGVCLTHRRARYTRRGWRRETTHTWP